MGRLKIHCADMMLMHASVIILVLDAAKHPSEYYKAKSEESNENDKPMKQISLPICPSMKSVL